MVARLQTATCVGIDAIRIEVEVDVNKHGFAGPVVVGLPDAAVKESLERVRSAIQNTGYEFPRFKTVVNLAPADLKKEGPSFDLTIALGILIGAGDIRVEDVSRYLILGELALDGRIRPIRGALSAALLAKEHGLRGVIVPIFDLRSRLGLAQIEYGPETRIVVVYRGEELAGLIVDRITQVMRVPVEAIEPPPQTTAKRRACG